MDAIRYPIGPFDVATTISDLQFKEAVESIRHYPKRLRQVMDQLTDADLLKTYRPGSWTVQQLIHHLADSQIHYYIRCKVAATEDSPTVSTFDENLWATLADTTLPPDASLSVIASINMRLTTFLDSLSVNAIYRTIQHPEKGALTIAQLVAMADWHCNHHLAHIQLAVKSEG
ncbi:MAG: YfiT family bacillithiol transferase [Lysinibacillus sp.]